MKAIRSTRLL